MAKFEIEYVLWIDSASNHDANWQFTESNFKDFQEDFSQVPLIRTVGHTIFENDEVLVLCQNLGEEAFSADTQDFEFHNVIRIPKVCIKSRIAMTVK